MNNPLFGEFCWNELVTGNLTVAKEFYSKLFGWEFVESESDETTYTMIKIGKDTFGGIWQIPTEKKEVIAPHWLNYILVDNIEKSVHKAVELGASIKLAISEIKDMGKMAIVTDPTGATFALWQGIEKCEETLDKELKDTFPASDSTAQY